MVVMALGTPKYFLFREATVGFSFNNLEKDTKSHPHTRVGRINKVVLLTAVLGDILRGSKLVWKRKTHKTLLVHAFAVNSFVVRSSTGYRYSRMMLPMTILY
jgi:hypothetical protein